MNKPNKGPFTTDQYGSYIKCGQRKIVCQFFNVISNYRNRHANAKRIVDCLNAFEGVDDHARFMKQTTASITQLQREKRELEELFENLNVVWKKGEAIKPTSILAKAVDYHLSK